MTKNVYRIAVLQFPGSNCEYETVRAVKAAGMYAEHFRWNRPVEELADFHGYVIPGGFSYQDRVRAGVVAAKTPVIRALIEAADNGKPILGICNGAQILIESGLIPGLEPGRVEMALAENVMRGRSDFYCRWIYVKVTTRESRTVCNCGLPEGTVFPIPIAHAEGRFITSENGLWERMEENGQILFRYCERDGEVTMDFPDNPNGSALAIAGLCNPKGNVVAMMPHPERADRLRMVPDYIRPAWKDFGSSVGDAPDREILDGPGPGHALFASLRLYLESGSR